MLTFKEYYLIENMDENTGRAIYEWLKKVIPFIQKNYSQYRAEVQKMGPKPTIQQLAALGQKVAPNGAEAFFASLPADVGLLNAIDGGQQRTEGAGFKRGIRTAFLIVGRILLFILGIIPALATINMELPPIVIIGVLVFIAYSTLWIVDGWDKLVAKLKDIFKKKEDDDEYVFGQKRNR